MYSEGFYLVCKDDAEFLNNAFGLPKRAQNWEVELINYKILILPIFDNINEVEKTITPAYLNDKKYINFFHNDEFIEFKKNKQMKIENKIIILFRKQENDEGFKYTFMGYYKNYEIDDFGCKHSHHLDFRNNDKIFFCYPKYYKEKNKYIVSLQYDSYRYDSSLEKSYRVYAARCIEKNELNTSDYVYENMKLLAMEHAVEKELKLANLEFLHYSNLEEMLFKLAYSNIDSQIINDPNEYQKQILKESSRIVNRFIEFMGE